MISIILITMLAWLAHLLSKIMKAKKKLKTKFKFKKWINLNVFYILFSFFCVILALSFVNFKDIAEIEQFGVVISLKHVVAFIIGWIAPSIIKAVVDLGKKKIKEFDDDSD